MKNWKPIAIATCLFVAVVLTTVLTSARRGAAVAEIADGTRYTLAMVAFTNSYQYQQRNLPGWVRPLTPLIPDRLEQMIFKAGGTMGMGNSAETNLMLVVSGENKSGNPTQPRFLRVRDDQGNVHDGNTVRGVLSVGSSYSYVFIAAVTPNRSERLFVELLISQADGTWTNAGPFVISNPRFLERPQWTAEPLPQKRVQEDVTATLVRFESGPGSPSVTRAPTVAPGNPRSTLMEFAFEQDGRPTDHYRVHKVSLADATGNQWSPHLDPLKPFYSSWVTNGTTEFIGGLWPGEDAWKIELQALRTADFAADEIWQVPAIALPSANTFANLTNEFAIGDSTIRIANILAPGVQVTNQWQWIVRYWGNESSVHPIGIECKNLGDRRPVILEARSENGTPFKIIDHQNVDHPLQCLFLQPPEEGATELHLRFAFPKLRKFNFIARPDFPDQAQR